MNKAVHHIAAEIVQQSQDWMAIPLKDLQKACKGRQRNIS
jgi:hypothetical protein